MVKTTPFIKAAGLALLGAIAAMSAAHAQSSQRDLELREQQLQNSAAGAQQRTQQIQTTTARQQQLLGYQVRRAKRTNLKQKCQLAGLSNC
jgi:hypothetical protein